jgi:Trypsin-co-occurring domain 1
MSAGIIVELSEGRKVIFGTAEDQGLSEIGAADGAVKASKELFKTALGSLGDLVRMLEATVDEMSKRPDKVEMEFGAKINADCNLCIVSGKGEAQFKVTLVWDAPEVPKEA